MKRLGGGREWKLTTRGQWVFGILVVIGFVAVCFIESVGT